MELLGVAYPVAQASLGHTRIGPQEAAQCTGTRAAWRFPVPGVPAVSAEEHPHLGEYALRGVDQSAARQAFILPIASAA
eukprot:11938773-Prorocentrum_lima.AAC.1